MLENSKEEREGRRRIAVDAGIGAGLRDQSLTVLRQDGLLLERTLNALAFPISLGRLIASNNIE